MDWLRRVVSFAIAALLSSSADAAGPDRQAVIRVVVAIEGGPEDPLIRAMIAEADAIWGAYEVRVVSSSANDVGAGDVVLAVSLMPVPAAAAGGRRVVSRATDVGGHLGAIRFCDNGVPEPVITLDPAAVRALLAKTAANMWLGSPTAVGRALGRVLAHEIGHFLLALPAHTPTGLMRTSFGGLELSELARWSFALDPVIIPRLRARLVQLSARDARSVR